MSNWCVSIWRKSVVLGVLLLLTLPQAIMAGESSVVASNGWVRAVPPGTRVSAAYLELKNNGSKDDRLISASSPLAGVVELHNVRSDAGVISMYPVEGIPLPAGGGVELKPGSYHIMLIDLQHQPKPGDTVEVVLQFEQAGSLVLDLPVNASPAGGMGHHHGGMPGGKGMAGDGSMGHHGGMGH
jgi:copper(I)-binding protein